jgi:hypothetical protein
VNDDRDPIADFKDATVWYYEGAAVCPVRQPEHPEESPRRPTKHEGHVELYDSWVRLGGINAHWVPREAVEGVSER